MLNEKYIFWQTEVLMRIGGINGDFILCGHHHEWHDLNSQANRSIALKSKQPLTDEQINALLSSDKVVFYPPDEDRQYMAGEYFHEPSTSFIQNLWNLAQHIAEILGKKRLSWETYYYVEPEIARKPSVFYREKDGKIELLTREQAEASAFENDYSWYPVLLLAVLRDDWDKLPSDLFIPDKTKYDAAEIKKQREREKGLSKSKHIRPLHAHVRY